MEVDSRFKNQPYLCSRDFVKPMSLVMDDRGSQSHSRSSDLRVSTKSRAPSPPALKKLDSPGLSQWYPGNPRLTMDQKENLIDKELSLTVVLPGGVEKTTVVHGSKPLMDLLVTLCAKYHLNPSGHTLELVTANRNNVKLKPNALIGTLDAEKVILKPKGEDKNKKAGPQMPEATVRMVINYRKTQKTILRVNPQVALSELLPAICEKCEFDPESTMLLRDVQSLAPLDLSSSLNDYAIREVYARDTRGQLSSPVSPSLPTFAGTVTPGKDKTQKEKENKGLFSKFRKSKKKSDQPTTASAPASPVLVSKPRPLSMALPSSNSSPFCSPASPTDVPKKRRAPQPPILVSQGSSSQLATRQRLNSEPNFRLDRDQSGLSRGSSADSSLKRTKRKAPPPPTSPSAVSVHQSAPQEENPQVDPAANTLEEIMEQEEMSASVKSATAAHAQGEDSGLNAPPDVSLQSPTADAPVQPAASVEGNGEDQSCDLSSDGNQLLSTVTETVSEMKSEEMKSEITDPPELTDTSISSVQVEDIIPPPVCEESTSDPVEGDLSAAPSSVPPPVTQEAEAEASVQANTETPREPTDGSEGPVAASPSRPVGEDAEVQTDFAQLPDPPAQHADQVSVSAIESAVESAGKKDMATLTEHVQQTPVPDHPQPCQDSTASATATIKPPSQYATNSEPKPKPSNELTRDYIPKVGMTTYTIVPQKSLEKLRYFEVALTLETPPEAPAEGLDIGSLHLDESSGQTGETEVLMEQSERRATLPREDLLTSTTTTTTQHTVNGSIPESTAPTSPTSLRNADKISASTNGASQAGPPAQVKEMKIPPATKPKPGSFRLAQHKKTPGYYVTSAAEKSLSASPGSGPREAQRSAESAAASPSPPLSPPVQCQEESAGATDVQLSPKHDRHAAFAQMTRQGSLSPKESSVGLSLEKLRSFAAPRPYSPTTPSRFAQAVLSAVKRSNSLPHEPKSPSSRMSPPVSPINSLSPVAESKALSEIQDCESRETDGDGAALQREESSLTQLVQMDGAGSP